MEARRSRNTLQEIDSEEEILRKGACGKELAKRSLQKGACIKELVERRFQKGACGKSRYDLRKYRIPQSKGRCSRRIPMKINGGKSLKHKFGAEIRFKEISREDQLSGLYLVKKIMETPENDEQGCGNEL